MRSKMHDHAKGQSLVLIALLMVAMIAFLGLVIDGGAVMLNRRSSQNASDAAAFAGVRALALRDSTTTLNSIWTTVTDIAAANRITITDVTATLIDQNGNDICQMNQSITPSCNSVYGGVPTSPYPTGVRVTTTLHLQPYFISIVVGNAAIPVRSVAAAQSGTPTGVSKLMPMTVFTATYAYDQIVSLQGVSNTLAPGAAGWVDYGCLDPLTPGKNQDVLDALTLYKSSGWIMADPTDVYYNPSRPTDWNTPPPSPNPWICSGPGMDQNSQFQTALDCWLNLNNWPCTTGAVPNWGAKPADNTWLVPVFNHLNGLTGSGTDYHTAAFAKFALAGYWFGNGPNGCNSTDKRGTNDCKNNLPPYLTKCETTPGIPSTMQKCIVGSFKKFVDPDSVIIPGVCNNNGLNICGFGLSE